MNAYDMPPDTLHFNDEVNLILILQFYVDRC
jgi:hypothetical protein